MKTKADQLLHPVLTVILRIKVFFTTIALIAGVLQVFQNLNTSTMVDWFEIFLSAVAIYGACLMLQTQKLGFYMVIIPNLITGIISIFFLPNMLNGVWMSFGQIAFIMLLMLLKRNGKNAYQVLWSNANMSAINDEESLTPESDGQPEETPLDPQENELWERIKTTPEDTMKQIRDKLALVNTYNDNYPNGLEIDKAKSILEFLEQKMEKMHEKENERQQGIDLWKHIEIMPEDDISEIQNKIDLVCTFIHRYGYPYGLKISEAESMLNCLEQKMEIWVNVNNSGTVELGENKPVFLEQVRRREQEVSLDAMSQDAFVAKLKELLGHYSDLRIEDYRGWIKEDTYNKLFDVIFPL